MQRTFSSFFTRLFQCLAREGSACNSSCSLPWLRACQRGRDTSFSTGPRTISSSSDCGAKGNNNKLVSVNR